MITSRLFICMNLNNKNLSEAKEIGLYVDVVRCVHVLNFKYADSWRDISFHRM